MLFFILVFDKDSTLNFSVQGGKDPLFFLLSDLCADRAEASVLMNAVLCAVDIFKQLF